jgi:predicted ATPase
LAWAARQTPLFLILDDLQWADEATLALLHYLATRVGPMPVVIVGTYRDSTLDTHPALVRTVEELLRLGLRPLKLAGLSQEAVGQMLQHLSRGEPPPQLVRVIFAETHGNPFLVEELYRHLVEEGKMFDEAGALRADVSVAEIGVPDGIVNLILTKCETIQYRVLKKIMTAIYRGHVRL